jgi:hypothetical protein
MGVKGASAQACDLLIPGKHPEDGGEESGTLNLIGRKALSRDETPDETLRGLITISDPRPAVWWRQIRKIVRNWGWPRSSDRAYPAGRRTRSVIEFELDASLVARRDAKLSSSFRHSSVIADK